MLDAHTVGKSSKGSLALAWSLQCSQAAAESHTRRASAEISVVFQIAMAFWVGGADWKTRPARAGKEQDR